MYRLPRLRPQHTANVAVMVHQLVSTRMPRRTSTRVHQLTCTRVPRKTSTRVHQLTSTRVPRRTYTWVCQLTCPTATVVAAPCQFLWMRVGIKHLAPRTKLSAPALPTRKLLPCQEKNSGCSTIQTLCRPWRRPPHHSQRLRHPCPQPIARKCSGIPHGWIPECTMRLRVHSPSTVRCPHQRLQRLQRLRRLQ